MFTGALSSQGEDKLINIHILSVLYIRTYVALAGIFNYWRLLKYALLSCNCDCLPGGLFHAVWKWYVSPLKIESSTRERCCAAVIISRCIYSYFN